MNVWLRLLRRDTGIASFVALGVVLVAGALLVGYGIWVRYAVESAVVFEDRFRARHVAQEGVGVAIGLLLEDQDPEIDWLGESWAQADEMVTADEATIRIRDEGSFLGLNWMDSTLWEALPGVTPDVAESVVSGRRSGNSGGGAPSENGWIGSAVQLAALNLDPADIDAIADVTTPFSPFNVNAVDADTLYELLISFGESSTQARRVVDQISQARNNHRLTSMDELSRTASALHPELRRAVEGWLVFSGPINVNTATREVLSYLATAYEVDEDRIDALVEARNDSPLRTLSEVERILGVGLVGDDGHHLPLARWLTFQSRFFRIVSETTHPTVRITAIVHRIWDPGASEWKVEIVSWKEEAGP